MKKRGLHELNKPTTLRFCFGLSFEPELTPDPNTTRSMNKYNQNGHQHLSMLSSTITEHRGMIMTKRHLKGESGLNYISPLGLWKHSAMNIPIKSFIKIYAESAWSY